MVEGISVPSWSICEHGLELHGWVVRTPKCKRFLWSLEQEAPCGGSSILSSESGSTCLFETDLEACNRRVVGFGEPQPGVPLSHRSIEWGFGWLQTNHELGEIVEYLATVAILLGVPFRGNSKIPGKKGLPTDVPQPLRQVVCLWGQTK